MKVVHTACFPRVLTRCTVPCYNGTIATKKEWDELWGKYYTVDLSFIDEHAQNEVYQYFFECENAEKLDLKTSALIKDAFMDGRIPITADNLHIILNREKRKERPKPFAINRNKFKEFAGRLPDDEDLEILFIEFLRAKFGV